jgi:CheY-like chemotaxis protein
MTTSTKRVLIVDDEPVLIALLREFFARLQHGHAYEITPAYSVVDAYDILLREQFDLILLDMVVPRLGDPWPWLQGLDLLQRVRHLGVKAPVFMMTGVWNTQKEAEASPRTVLSNLLCAVGLRWNAHRTRALHLHAI